MSQTFNNKKAHFEYQITEDLEAGIVLTGLEIKAIRQGRVNLFGSYVKIMGEEAFWIGGIIEITEGDNQRTRKLLLHQKEIKRLIGKSKEEGLALIPLKLYLKKGRAKLLIGVGRGLKKHDKRDKLRQRDLDREAERSMKS